MSEFGPSFLAALRSWNSDQRVTAAGAERRSQRWNRQIALEQLDMRHTLASLAGGAPVTLRTGWTQYSAVIDVTGEDFVSITNSEGLRLLSLGAIESVRIDTSWRTLTFDHAERSGSLPSLVDALNVAVAERPLVRVRTIGSSEMISGELAGVGADVLLVATAPNESVMVAGVNVAEVLFVVGA